MVILHEAARNRSAWLRSLCSSPMCHLCSPV